MKRLVLLIFALAAPALAQNDAVNGFCTLGASKALVSGLQSSNFQQGIIPKCTVTVYLTGTTNTATIFANASGGTLSNPFTSTSPSGQWLLYAATGLHVDIVMSGGVSPNTFPSAFTLTDVVVGGGGGGGGSGFPFILGSTTIASGSTTTLLTGLTVNGVTLNSGGSTSLFLNQAGGYSTPAGGGSSIPGTVNQAIFSAGGGTALASKATFDAAGNSKTLSDDGTFNAFLAQTTPTSNDGIKNSLQSPNTLVVASNDYPCVEGTFSGSPPLFPGAGNYRLGFGNPAPFANGTTLLDNRTLCGARGAYYYNPQMGTTGNVLWLDRIVSNQLPPGGGITTFFIQSDIEYSGSGINDGFTGGGPDSEGRTFDAFELMRRGIQSVYNLSQSAYSGGDNHLFQNQITNNRGSWDINGEGFNWLRNQIGQNLTPMVMTATNTHAAGATLIQGSLTSNVPFVGDGTYLTNTTRGGPIVQVIQDIQPNAAGTCGQAGQWIVNGATLTPDNIGCVAAGTSLSNKRYGGTTNATVTVTGLTSALTVSQTACVSDHIFTESAAVVNAGSFSGGTATGVVLALRYPHQPNFYVAQGSHACNFMEVKANQTTGSPVGRQLFRIIAVEAGTPNHYLYSRTVFGGWDSGLSGYAKTYDVANAGTTLTRNGSGVVTAPVSDGNFLLSNASIIIAGCSDSSFNGISVVTSDTGSSVTWANPGAGGAGTTTCSKDIELLSKLNNTQGIRDMQEFPGAEIVNTNDPVTFAVCSTAGSSCSVEPNTNFVVTAGDVLENNPYADVYMGFDRNLMNFQSQTSRNIAQLMHFDQISGFIPESTSWWRVAITDSANGYQGFGGSKSVGLNLMDFSDTIAPFATLFQNLPVPADSIFSFNGCLYGCANPKSHFTFYGFAMNNGFYSQTINQSNYGVTTLSANSVTNELFNKFESNQGLSYFVSNGASGTGRMENLLEWTPGSTRFSVASNFGSTSNQLLMTPTGSSFSQPITITGTADGCATFITGVLGSTGVACGSSGGIILTTTGTSGAATLVGTTLNIPVYASSGGGVTTFNTRSGTVVPVSGDYSFSLISGNLGTTQGPSGLTGILLDTAGTLSVAVAANFPTLNQSTTGSAATLTTPRTIAGTSFNGSANVSLANKFIVQGTADAGLSGAQFLGALGTCLLKNTTTTGVLSCGAAGTDYLAINGSSAALSVATSSAFGVVKPDNTTITITAGVISAVGGGGSGITGQTAGWAIEAATATTATGPFPMDDAITTAGFITLHKNVQIIGTGTANGWLLPEGTAITGVALSEALYPDSTLHRWMQNPNNIGALMIPGVATAATAAHLAVFASNGIDLVDGGAVPAGGGTVTAVSIVTANGISGTSSGGATPALTLALGVITPTSTNGVSAATMAFNDATSSIQTQLNAKAPNASPTFTGTVTIPSGASLATPASLTLTSATGLPISTGVSGLGTGMATFLATPSSANLRATLTDESGTGAALFAGGNIGAATGTSLLVTGNIDGTAPLTVTTGTTATLGGTFKSGYTLNQNATAATAVAYTLPTAAAGLQYCVGNSWNGTAATTGVLTVNASATGQFIIFTDGTLSATGGNVTSGGAAADAACFVGVDATHWQQFTQRGTWTKH